MKLEVSFDEQTILMAALNEHIKSAKRYKATLGPDSRTDSFVAAFITADIEASENLLKQVEKLR